MNKKRECEKMEYEDLVKDQIDKIRQVRNDDPNNYPRSIETLWLFLRNRDIRVKIDQKKKELKIIYSCWLGCVPLNLEPWDTIFQYTLDLLPEYEGVSL